MRQAAVRYCDQTQANVVVARTELAAAARLIELFERDLASLGFVADTPRERLLDRARSFVVRLKTRT